MEGFNALLGIMNNVTPLTEKEVIEIRQLLVLKTYKKNELFLKQGTLPVYAAFVVHGGFREFYTDKDGREFNKAFCFRSDFTGSYYDLHQKKPSSVTIQALTKSDVLLFRISDISRLKASSVSWLRIALGITHELLMKKLEREFQLLTLSADERYTLLQKQYPKLEQLLPAYHIASFLGVTPISFSRLKKKRKNFLSFDK